MPRPDGADCAFRPVLPEWQDYCDAVDQARRRAGSLQSVPFIVAGVLTPVIGIVIDRCVGWMGRGSWGDVWMCGWS